MSTAIGRAALVLSTDASGAKAGLAKFGADARRSADEAAGSIRGRFGGLFSKGLFLGAGAAIGGGLVGLVASAAGSFAGLAEDIDSARDAAIRLGTSVASVQGLQHAAKLSGVSVEELDSGLGKFRRQVEGPLDEALYGFASRLEGVTDPGQRAQMLVEAFGKSGLKLAGMFEGGEAGLREMVQEAQKLGFAVSDADAAKIDEMNDAVARAKGAFRGAFQQIMVSVAPVVQAIAERLSPLLAGLQPVLAFVGEYLQTMFDLWSAVFTEVAALVGGVVDVVWEWISGLFDLEGATLSARDLAIAAFRAVGTAGAYAWDIIKAGAGAVAIGIGVVIEHALAPLVDAFGSVISLAKDLPDALRPDWLDGMIAGTERFADRVRGAGQGMREWGTGAIDSFGKSAQTFNAWLDTIANQQRTVTEQQTRQTVERMEEVAAVADSLKLDNAALVRGSSAEVSARLRHEVGGQQVQQLAEQKKTNSILAPVPGILNAINDAIKAASAGSI